MKKIICFFLYWVWQFPQMLLGRFVIWLTEAEPELYTHPKTGEVYTVYYFDRDRNAFCRWLCDECCCERTIFDKKRDRVVSFFAGVALVEIILPRGRSELYYILTVPHEDGHNIQSLILGFLYLLVVGFPSVTFHLISRACERFAARYYDRWPESWADRLGGVDRDAVLRRITRPDNARFPAV